MVGKRSLRGRDGNIDHALAGQQLTNKLLCRNAALGMHLAVLFKS